FITHQHSDHHMGLIQLIEKHYEHNGGKGPKLRLILPPMVTRFLKSTLLNRSNEIGQKCSWVTNYYFERSKPQFTELLQVKDIDLIPVNHCSHAYGISIIDKAGFK